MCTLVSSPHIRFHTTPYGIYMYIPNKTILNEYTESKSQKHLVVGKVNARSLILDQNIKKMKRKKSEMNPLAYRKFSR